MSVTPLFLFSLPRSGSTMLQRELARHPAIATVSEPWFLLGLIAPGHVDEAVTSYGFEAYRAAVEDVIAALPGGEADWTEAARAAAQILYDRLARGQGAAGDDGSGAAFFLDKTPRYALAPEAVVRLFPEAPCVVLWRNPLSIAASMMKTYSRGRWNLYLFGQDFYLALPRLVEFARAHEAKVLTLRYEDVVADMGAAVARSLDHIGLEATGATDAAEVALNGRMGDPTGGLNRTGGAGKDGWKASFANPLRRAWARRYLRWLGVERLAVMGYDLDGLLAEVDSCSGTFGHLLDDLVLMPRGILRQIFSTRLAARQLGRALRGSARVELG